MNAYRAIFRMPNASVALGLSILAGLAEGVGLTLFIPLLELMNGNEAESVTGPARHVIDFIQAIGVPVTLLTLLLGITGLVLGSFALGYLQKKILIQSQQGFARTARKQLVDRLFHSTWPFIAMQSHGDIFNRLMMETHRAGYALQHGLLSLGSLIQVLIYTGFSFALSWQLMSLALAFGLLALLIVRPFVARSEKLGECATAANKGLSSDAVEYLKTAKLLKASASEKAAISKIWKQADNLYDALCLSEINIAKVYYILQALPVILLAVLISVSFQVLNMDASETLVFLFFMARIAPRLTQFQQNAQGFKTYAASLNEVDLMLGECAEAREDTHSGGQQFDHVTGTIEVRNVSFQYPGRDAPILNKVNLTIRRNQMIALIGRSGAGKSTLIDILIGLQVPQSGQILIDGVNLRDINLISWRRRVGYVTQDILITHDTVKNNLRFINPGASDALVRKCMDLANFTEVLNELPEGMDTILGENGVRLSGGQRQRLSLARALISEPDVLFLDEATSALDNESEKLVQDAIISLSETMTIIVVAHRLSTIRRANRIFMLDKGTVVEAGDFETLIDNGGRFKDLHDMQFT